jgi:hypothetical protein
MDFLRGSAGFDTDSGFEPGVSSCFGPRETVGGALLADAWEGGGRLGKGVGAATFVVGLSSSESGMIMMSESDWAGRLFRACDKESLGLLNFKEEGPALVDPPNCFVVEERGLSFGFSFGASSEELSTMNSGSLAVGLDVLTARIEVSR